MLPNAHNPEARVKETENTQADAMERGLWWALSELPTKSDAEHREKKNSNLGGLEKVVGEQGNCKALEW